jgi:hypothetical protein
MTLRHIALLIGAIFLAACAGQAPGRLVRTQQPSAAELQQNWRSYKVYQLMDSALLYQELGGKTILLDDHWKEVAGAAAPGSIGFRGPTTPVFQITGYNGAPFGYIIYTVGDSVGVTIVDPQTVRLYYSIPRKGGP